MSLKQIISSALVGVGLAGYLASGCGDTINNYGGDENGGNTNYTCESGAEMMVNECCGRGDDSNDFCDYEDIVRDCQQDLQNVTHFFECIYSVCTTMPSGRELEDSVERCFRSSD